MRRSMRRLLLSPRTKWPNGTLVYDDFSTATPQKGTVVDAGSAITISGGKLSHTAISPSLSSSRIHKDAAGNGFARSGKGFFWDGRATGGDRPSVGVLTNPASITDANIQYRLGSYLGTGIQAINASLGNTISYGTPIRTNCMRFIATLPTGALLFVNGRLQAYFPSGTTTPLYPIISSTSTTGTAEWDTAMVIDLTAHDARWGTDTGWCTSAATSVVADQAYTMEPDAYISVVMTPATGVTQDITIRETDSLNKWIVRCAEATDTMKIIEVVAGAETERASAALTQNNGSAITLMISVSGTVIRAGTSNIPIVFYVSAFTSMTGTTMRISRTAGNLRIFPLDWTGKLPSIVGVKRRTVYCFGDSKTLGTGDAGTGEMYGYPPLLIDALGAASNFEIQPRGGVGGRTTAGGAAAIDGLLAALTVPPDYICYNLGVNDFTSSANPGGLPVEATFKANLAYCLDRMHAVYPNAKVGVARVWKQYYDAVCDVLDGWIETVVDARSPWCVRGPDERLILPAVGMTGDGIHPTAAGYAAMATAWRAVFGL